MRDQLIIILLEKIFNETADCWDEITLDIFRDHYPRYPTANVSSFWNIYIPKYILLIEKGIVKKKKIKHIVLF